MNHCDRSRARSDEQAGVAVQAGEENIRINKSSFFTSHS